MKLRFFRTIALTFVVLTLSLASFTAVAKICRNGKLCGARCISKSEVCRTTASKPDSPVAPASQLDAIRPVPGSSVVPDKGQKCVSGKLCRTACIPDNAKCPE